MPLIKSTGCVQSSLGGKAISSSRVHTIESSPAGNDEAPFLRILSALKVYIVITSHPIESKTPAFWSNSETCMSACSIWKTMLTAIRILPWLWVISRISLSVHGGPVKCLQKSLTWLRSIKKSISKTSFLKSCICMIGKCCRRWNRLEFIRIWSLRVVCCRN